MVQAYHYGSSGNTNIFRSTLNPIWNERIFIKSFLVGNFVPPLVLNVHDYDPKGDDPGVYEFLGSTSIFFKPSHFANSYNYIPEPNWHVLRYSSDTMMGKLSLSCTILASQGHKEQYHSYLMEEKEEDYLIKIRILGLRNLQSAGLIPVKKPYIRINTSTLMKRSTTDQDIPYSDLSTIPKQGGENPNIGEIMK